MGGKSSKTVYVQDPNLIRLIEETRKQNQDLDKRLQDAYEEAKKMHDPKHYNKVKEEVFQTYLHRVKTELKFEDLIKRRVDDEVHFGSIGPISSGKSSMWNALLGLNLFVGLGKTTADAKLIYPDVQNVPQDHKKFAWDAPGNERDFDFLDPTVMNFFYSLDYCFLLFNTDPDDPQLSAMARLIYAVHPTSLIMVRTFCDNATAFPNQKPVLEVLQEDARKVKQLLGAPVPVLGISSKNILKTTGDRFDWDLLVKLWNQLPRNKPSSDQDNNHPFLDISPYKK